MVDVRHALEFTGRVEAMLQDPELTGELLALAITLAFGSTFAQARERLGWEPFHLRSVLRRDVKRYEPPRPDEKCTGTMIRRQGPCGKRARSFGWLVDPATGVRTPQQLCSRHASQDAEDARRRAWQAWHEAGKPVPPANTGGVLERYFSCDWDKVYDWADPNRLVPGPPDVRPQLRLIKGGSAGAELA